MYCKQQLQQLVQGLMTEKEGADKAANAATAAAAEAKAREEDAKRTTEQVHYAVQHQFMSLHAAVTTAQRVTVIHQTARCGSGCACQLSGFIEALH
jgi:hypothetical protein